MNRDTQIFDPIDTDSVSAAVVTQIEKLIISGVLKSGQRLPSERDLAEQTGVSRPKIRDAIKTLEGHGLLTSLHGEGTFVASLSGTALSPAIIDLFTRHPEAFTGYLEFRREVEGFAAFTAAQRATDDDLGIIRAILDEMVATDPSDSARELELDVQFHGAIVDATHNAMLTHTMASIYELLARGVFLGRNLEQLDKSYAATLLKQHQDIGNAVLGRDPEAAATAAEAHMDYVEATYREANSLESRASMARKRRKLLDVSTTRAGRRHKAS